MWFGLWVSILLFQSLCDAKCLGPNHSLLLSGVLQPYYLQKTVTNCKEQNVCSCKADSALSIDTLLASLFGNDHSRRFMEYFSLNAAFH